MAGWLVRLVPHCKFTKASKLTGRTFNNSSPQPVRGGLRTMYGVVGLCGRTGSVKVTPYYLVIISAPEVLGPKGSLPRRSICHLLGWGCCWPGGRWNPTPRNPDPAISLGDVFCVGEGLPGSCIFTTTDVTGYRQVRPTACKGKAGVAAAVGNRRGVPGNCELPSRACVVQTRGPGWSCFRAIEVAGNKLLAIARGRK